MTPRADAWTWNRTPIATGHRGAKPRASDLRDPAVPPKSTDTTESWDAALGAYPPSEDEQGISRGDVEHQRSLRLSRHPKPQPCGSPLHRQFPIKSHS
jgi:hypothetical protein